LVLVLLFKTLRSQLIVAVTLVVTTVVLVQLCIRAFVISPQLKSLANESLKFELLRLASEVNQELRALENLVYDNAVWDETYKAVSERNTAWFEKTYFIPLSYSTLGITGWYFFDAKSQLVAGDYKRVGTNAINIEKQIVQSGALVTSYLLTEELAKTHFAIIENEPVALVASPILPSNEEGESNGTAIIIQDINDAFIKRITPNLNGDILLHPLSTLSKTHLAASVKYSELGDQTSTVKLRESDTARLYILFTDTSDNPLFALSIKRPSSPENDSIFEGSLLAGVLFSVIALIVFYGFLNRKLIAPFYQLLRFVEHAQDEKDFSLRCELDGSNEVFQLSHRLNQLFKTIEEQQSILSEKNAVLENLSRTDALTGLSNRRYFDEWMAQLSSTQKTTHSSISLLIIDIDHFKKFNDFYGHAKGDEALTLVAQCIKQSVHEATDKPFRYGGEEFAVVLQQTSLEEAKKVADNIRTHVEQRCYEHAKSPTSTFVTVSIGVACKEQGVNLDSQSLFQKADEALYNAKRLGRNAVSSISDTN